MKRHADGEREISEFDVGRRFGLIEIDSAE
jgi:hypothetical protein